MWRRECASAYARRSSVAIAEIADLREILEVRPHVLCVTREDVPTDVEFARDDDETLAWRVLHENDCAPALPSDL